MRVCEIRDEVATSSISVLVGCYQAKKKKLKDDGFERETQTTLRPVSCTSSQLQLLSLSRFGYKIVK